MSMTLLLIGLLVVAAVVVSWLKWRRSARILVLLAVASFFAVGCGPIPQVLLSNLQSGYSASAVVGEAASTTIIVLGFGTERVKSADGVKVEVPLFAFSRLVKALELYRACRLKSTHCTILISGGDPQHHGTSEASVYGAQLQKLGADPSDLLIEGRSLNTWQNAQYTAALLRAHPAEQLFLVTSGFHLRRSELYFKRLGLQGQPVRADHVDAIFGLIPIAYNFELADLAVHEYIGVVRYFVYERMGWNAAAESDRAGSS
jgi:uncharacterized SAM-binding protein YcdF (DUF218 family)